MPVYIEKYGDLVGCHHRRTTNKRQTRKDRATQPMDHGMSFSLSLGTLPFVIVIVVMIVIVVAVGCYLVLLGQYGMVLAGTWLYWVSMGRHWLVLGGTGSV